MPKAKAKPDLSCQRKAANYSAYKRTPSFSGHLWKLLHYDNIISVGEIAEILDVAPKTVYGWSEGRGNPSPGQIKRIFDYTGSSEVLEYFLKGTDWMLVMPEAIEEGGEIVTLQGLQVMDLAGRMAGEIKKSMADNILTLSERKNIHDRIQPILQSLLTLDASLLPEGYKREK